MPASPIIQRLAPVKNLGVFKDWRVADAQQLLQCNLIYGFNGSGKTTLSRILGCLEIGKLRPELPEGGTFEVQMSNGTVIKSTGALDALQGRILVFNVDFIEESFGWKEGTARPVFYLGREQSALAAKLAETTAAVKVLVDQQISAQALKNANDKAFVQYKRDSARLIVEQLSLGRRYDASNLVADYASGSYGEVQLVGEEERTRLRATYAQEVPLARCSRVRVPTSNLADLVRRTREFASTTLGAMALEDLRDHEVMRGWIADGFKYHEQQRLKNCLFCGNDLSRKRLDLLRNSIDSRFARLKDEILTTENGTRSLQTEYSLLSGSVPSPNDVAQSVRADFLREEKVLSAAFNLAQQIAVAALSVLSQKTASPHLPVDVAHFSTIDDSVQLDIKLNESIESVNSILDKHNAEFDYFDKAKSLAGKRLKEHYLAEGQRRYLELERDAKLAQDQVNEVELRIIDLKREEEKLRREVRKHGPAAELINKLIHNYLGRKDIELVTRDDGYQLHRNGKLVRGSLSEGEKTAIALCYFLSTLEAEGRRRKDLIVVIDDPVSSLDTKALNYAFSIVRSSVGEAGQLFLLTHNLNFMNEAKKWLKPKTEKEAIKRGKKGTGTATLLFLDANQPGDSDTRSATLKELPKFIREYESEYHYLFHLVLRFFESPEENVGYYFIIPNALRKLMDIFLAFKFPGSEGLASKVEKIAKLNHGLDAGRIQALERLAQVESHADNLDDLVTFSSMTVEETREASATLLDLMAALDGEHFTLMKGICK